MSAPPPHLGTQVNQVDYIEALEDDLARETKARRILQALVNQRARLLGLYIERYGDITDDPATRTGNTAREEDVDGAGTATG